MAGHPMARWSDDPIFVADCCMRGRVESCGVLRKLLFLHTPAREESISGDFFVLKT
jgi:hypothetical protein